MSAPLDAAIDTIVSCLRSGGTLYACGNGGSDAEAGHLVAELLVRFAYDRPALRAMFVTHQPIVGSAIDNDLGPDKLYSRQIEAWVGPGDVVMWLTTSGKSGRVARGLDFLWTGVQSGAQPIALTGPDGLSDLGIAARAIVVRSLHTTTAAIQEDHQRWVHEIARRVEEALCPR